MKPTYRWLPGLGKPAGLAGKVSWAVSRKMPFWGSPSKWTVPMTTEAALMRRFLLMRTSTSNGPASAWLMAPGARARGSSCEELPRLRASIVTESVPP